MTSWTEQPHWVVTAYDEPGVPVNCGHFQTEAEAREQKLRSQKFHRLVVVERVR